MTVPASRTCTPRRARSPFWAEKAVWLFLAAGLALNTAFSRQIFGAEAASGGLTQPLPAENYLWAPLCLVLLCAAAWRRFFGKDAEVADSPITHRAPLLAALALDILALALGTAENGATRTLASGFVRSGLWSVPLMTVAIGLHLGNFATDPRSGMPTADPRSGTPAAGPRSGTPAAAPRSAGPAAAPRSAGPAAAPRSGFSAAGRREEAACLAALLLHTVLLAMQPDLFSVLLQWAALVLLACFAPAARRARRTVWLAAAGVFGAVAWYIRATPYLSGRITAWAGPGHDAHAAALCRAWHEAGAWGLNADLLPAAAQALPAGPANNAFTTFCLWQGTTGGAGYMLAWAVLLVAAGCTARLLKSPPLRLGIWGGVIALGLSQLFVVAGELGWIPLTRGFGLAFLGGWQAQAALTALWLWAVTDLPVRGASRPL